MWCAPGFNWGPLLFLLYVNDIKNVSNILFPIIYADDTNIFIQGNCINQLILEMNRELAKLNLWFQSNKLSLNINKTHYMVFHRSRRKFNKTVDIIINNNVIEEKKSTTFLGVILDSGLTWAEHVNYVKNKVSKAMGIINKVKHCLNRHNLISLYNSFVYPYLIYCIEIWGSTNDVLINPLFILQKKNLFVL